MKKTTISIYEYGICVDAPIPITWLGPIMHACEEYGFDIMDLQTAQDNKKAFTITSADKRKLFIEELKKDRS